MKWLGDILETFFRWLDSKRLMYFAVMLLALMGIIIIGLGVLKGMSLICGDDPFLMGVRK